MLPAVPPTAPPTAAPAPATVLPIVELTLLTTLPTGAVVPRGTLTVTGGVTGVAGTVTLTPCRRRR